MVARSAACDHRSSVLKTGDGALTSSGIAELLPAGRKRSVMRFGHFVNVRCKTRNYRVDSGNRLRLMSSRRGSVAPRPDRQLRGNPVRRRKGGYAGAAPATVSGERLSNRATGAEKHWEGQTAAATREPGNLPRRVERPRAGCPGGSLARDGVRHPDPSMRPLGPCPPTNGVCR